jgi:hypothetical protein
MRETKNSGVLRALAIGSAGAAVAAVIWTMVESSLIFVNGTWCAYGDGESYCAMARGHPGVYPFSGRIVMPAIVRLIHYGSLSARFRAVGMASLVLAAIATFALGRIAASRVGASPAQARDIGVIAGSLTVVMVWGVKAVWSEPVLTDTTATAFGVATVALIFSNRDRLLPWIGIATALTVCTRETWAVPLALVGIILLFRRARVGAVVLAGVAFGWLIVLGQPHVGSDNSLYKAWGAFQFHFGEGFEDYAWQTAVVVGLLPLLVLSSLKWLLPRAREQWIDRDPLLICLGALVLGNLAMATIGGIEVTRLSSPIVPFVAVLALVCAVRRRRQLETIVVVVGSILVWEPWQVNRGGNWTTSSNSSRTPLVIGVIAWAVALVLTGGVHLARRWQRNQPRPLRAQPWRRVGAAHQTREAPADSSLRRGTHVPTPGK